MSSDNSSSSSESEDEGTLNESVTRVFQAVKDRLASVKLTAKNKVKNAKSISDHHKLIYQTFDSSDSDSCDDDEEDREVTIKKQDPCAFFIDKGPADGAPNADSDVVTFDLSNMDDNTEESVADKTVPSKSSSKSRKKKRKEKAGLSSRLETGLKTTDVYINVDPYHHPKSQKDISTFIKKQKEPEVMKKSVITDGFEKQDSIATSMGKRQLKKQRKLEREKTKGDKWFNMPATEVDDDRKHDLEVLQMRKALDPKRFYKANDLKVAPKYFQFGKVVEDATDFYSSRIPKKQRKSTIVEELLADSEFRQYNKRKYAEVQDAKRLGKGPYQHMKRIKMKKKAK